MLWHLDLWKKNLCAFLFLCVTSFLFDGLFSSISIAGFLWICLNTPFKTLVKTSFIFSFVFHLILLHWLLPTTAIGWIFMSFYLSLYWILFACVFKKYGRTFPLCVSVFWVFLEVIRGHLFSGFPWLPLGTSFHHFFVMRQSVRFYGIEPLSLLIIFTNINMIHWIWCSNRMAKRNVFLCVAILTLNFVYGSFVWMQRRDKNPLEENRFLKMGVLHTELSIEEKWDKKNKENIVDEYCSLSHKFCQQNDIDCLIFPETSVPAYIFLEKDLLSQIETLSRTYKIPVLFGSLDYVEDQKNQTKVYNCSVFLNHNEDRVELYRKQKPIPFGEYFPFKEYIPFASLFLPEGVSLSKGQKSNVFFIKDICLANLICYEVCFSSLIKKFVRKGAQVLVVTTNDAWFGDWHVKQRLAMLKMKAIEFGLPIVRVSNQGVSCLMNRYGEIEKQREERGILFCNIMIPKTVEKSPKKISFSKYQK